MLLLPCMLLREWLLLLLLLLPLWLLWSRWPCLPLPWVVQLAPHWHELLVLCGLLVLVALVVVVVLVALALWLCWRLACRVCIRQRGWRVLLRRW